MADIGEGPSDPPEPTRGDLGTPGPARRGSPGSGIAGPWRAGKLDASGAGRAKDASSGARPKRGRRLGIGLGVGLVVVLVAAIVASVIRVPYYALTPGTAVDVAGLVGVPRADAHKHSGAVDLTDVELVQLKAIDYPYFAWFDSNASVTSAASITGPATATQYDEQGAIDMANAQQAATVVAMRTLGYPVRATPDGVVVYQPEPGSPAARYLRDDDVITGLDAQVVTTFASLAAALRGLAPGTTVTVHVHPFGSTRSSDLRIPLGVERVATAGGARYPVCSRSGARSSLPAYEVKGAEIGCLGLVYDPYVGGSEPAYAVSGLPFKVNLNAEGIIGPSAGLAFTLGLLDKLDSLNLTGGRKVAATGTMSMDGAVGPVGGVAQKTIAVRNAGATVFLVPPEEYGVAKAHAGPHLEVLSVSSISAALRDLERLGGKLERVQAAG